MQDQKPNLNKFAALEDCPPRGNNTLRLLRIGAEKKAMNVEKNTMSLKEHIAKIRD